VQPERVKGYAVVKPKNVSIDAKTGTLSPCDNRIIRRLSDIQAIFHDRQAAKKMLESGDVIVYEVLEVDIPEERGHLRFSTTILHPGAVGDEYFMTKGHYHAERDTAEFYYSLSGKGIMLLENEEGDFESHKFNEGTAVYVPPYYAHRSVNTGNENLIILCVYPADAGHDYGAIEKAGFRKRAVERDGKVELIQS
jgi:glucose-6-phosphate isomerase